jgi:hypothetical protein
LGESLWAVKSLVIHVIYDFDIIWVFSTAVFRLSEFTAVLSLLTPKNLSTPP